MRGFDSLLRLSEFFPKSGAIGLKNSVSRPKGGQDAWVAELVYAHHLKWCGAIHAGSTPAPGTRIS